MIQERDKGLTALQRGDYEGAIYHLERAYEAEPTDFQTLLSLGAAYYQAKRDREALRALSEAVAFHPDNASAHYNLGICLDRMNRRHEATRAVQLALSLQPDYPLAEKVLKKWMEESGRVPALSSAQAELPVALSAKAKTIPWSEPVVETPPASIYTVPDRRPRHKSRAETSPSAEPLKSVETSPAEPTPTIPQNAHLQASFPAVYIVSDRRPRSRPRAKTPPSVEPLKPVETPPAEPTEEVLPQEELDTVDRAVSSEVITTAEAPRAMTPETAETVLTGPAEEELEQGDGEAPGEVVAAIGRVLEVPPQETLAIPAETLSKAPDEMLAKTREEMSTETREETLTSTSEQAEQTGRICNWPLILIKVIPSEEAHSVSATTSSEQVGTPSTDSDSTSRPTRRKATSATTVASGPVGPFGYTDYTQDSQESRPYHPSAVLALKWAIGSLFLSPLLFGIILSFLAISKALEIRRLLSISDRWRGRNLVNAAIVLSCIGIVISSLALLKLFFYTAHLK